VSRQLSAQEIEDIRRIKFKDVLLATTDIGAVDVQEDVFTWKAGKLRPFSHRETHIADIL